MAEPDSPHFIGLTLSQTYLENFLKQVLPDISLVSFEEIPTGWNNKAVKLITPSGNLLLRLSKSTWPKEKILNEVAALAYVKEHTKLPVPSVVQHGFSTNTYNFHWMVQEFIEGEMLEKTWRTLPEQDKQSVLHDIRSVILQFQSKTYDMIGGWTLDTSNSVVQTVYFDGMYEYPSEAEFFLGQYTKRLEQISTGDLASHLKADLQTLEGLLPDIKKLILSLDKAPVVLFHGDFAFRNMLVKRDSDGALRLAALLDWEWCGRMPLFLDWASDWLEEESPEDIKENQWITSEMVKNSFPVFSNLPSYQVRKALMNLMDACHGWRFHPIEAKLCDSRNNLQERIQQIVPFITSLNK